MNSFFVERELKEEFLALYENKSSYKVTKSRLITTDKYEEAINKKVIDWSASDIEDFFRSINSTNPMSLRGYMSVLKSYVDFCKNRIENKEILPNFYAGAELFRDINSYKRCINQRKSKENLLLYDEYLEIINDSEQNLMARTMFVFFWNGIDIENVNDVFFIERSAICEEDNSVTCNNGEKIYIKPNEMKVITDFIKKQTEIPVRTKIGDTYEFSYNPDALFHIISPSYKYIFPNVVGIQENRPQMSSSVRLFQQTMRREMKNRCYTNAYNEVLKKYNKIDLKPKGIIKSGGYHRAIIKFNLTNLTNLEKIKNGNEEEYNNANFVKIRAYLKPYGMFRPDELEYILSSKIYETKE